MIITKKFTVVALLVSAFSFQSNAEIVTQDYTTEGDGLITFDTVGQNEWLDVSMFVDMNLPMLQGANQWTEDGFHLATDDDVFNLFKNAGITYIVDSIGPLDFGTSHDGQSITALTDLYTKLGGGAENFGGSKYLHGIIADDDNDGFSHLARLHVNSREVVLNGNGDDWGGTFVQSHEQVGAFFVRSTQSPGNSPATPSSNISDVSATAPVALSLLGLGLAGLSRRRRSK